MSFNRGKIVNSENRDNQINGNDYLEVATAYFNNTMYEDGLTAIDDLFNQTKAVFNAMPKTINIATALSVGGDLVSEYEDEEFAENIIKKLALNQEKMEITTMLLLGKSVLLEVQNFDNEEDGIDTAYHEPDFPYTLSYYPADQYELIKEGNQILWAEIQGIKLVVNEDGDGYEEVDISKVYMRDGEGLAFSYVLDEDNNKTDEIEYSDGVLPIHEVVTKYDLKQLFYSIDRINEYEAFIRNILYLAGEPILMGTGVDKLNQVNATAMGEDKYNKLKAMFTRSEQANMSMIEITGASARVMMDKQSLLVKAIIKDFPEYSISDVLEGGNTGEAVTRIRLTEVLSRIQEIRRVMEDGMNAVIGIVAFYEGKEFEKKYVKFQSMLDADIGSALEVTKIAYETGLLSRKSAMYNIRELFLTNDVELEYNQMIDELTDELKTSGVVPTTVDSDSPSPNEPDNNKTNMKTNSKEQPLPIG